MKILAIHRYFWPDTPPYASLLRSIAEQWSLDGHDVTVFTAQPSYKAGAVIPKQPSRETLNGVSIVRMALLPESKRNLVARTINLFLFMAGILFHAFIKRRYDVIMASTAPPVLLGTAARQAARLTGAKFIYHCQDIQPDAGEIAGIFKKGALYKLLRKIDTKNCQRAAAVVVLSEDMRDTLNARDQNIKNHVRIINNFVLPDFDKNDEAPDSVFDKPEGRFRIVFAGNVGRFQGLETAVDAVALLESLPQVELLFVGEGSALEALKIRAGAYAGSKIIFHPHQPVRTAKRIIETADLCLVSLVPGIYRVAYPSKTMAYLSAGRSLLVAVEAESELSRLIRSREVGYVTSPGDAEAMAAQIKWAYRDRGRLEEMGIRARALASELFSESKAKESWSRLLDSVTQGS